MKRLWTGAFLATAAGALLFTAAPAAAATCGQAVVDDWFEDGRVDDVYPIKCYRNALKLLPEDAQNYSDAPDEINRALQDAIRQQQRLEADQSPPSESPAESTSPPSDTGSAGGGEAEESPTTGDADSSEPPAEASGGSAPPTGGGGSGGGPSESPSSGVAGEVSEGESEGATNGVVGEAIGKLGSGSANSIPVPLIIVGALALLLLTAGSAGLLARKLQERKLAHEHVRDPDSPHRRER